jgi:FKBP-type peptidyl-prolyl cis-trans isomerase
VRFEKLRILTMNKLLTLLVVVLATLGGRASAGPQPTATPKPLATTVSGSRSNGDNRTTTIKSTKSNASLRAVLTQSSRSNGSERGKVSQVGRGSFTLTAKGKQYKFLSPKGGAPPKVGQVVDVTYTGTLGGAEPPQATTVISSRSNGSY